MERSTQRFLGIEALRLLCAVGVVIWHYQHFYFGMGGNDELSFIRERQPLWWLFGIFYEYGYVSIWFFWMISGFVFFWKYHEAIASGTMHGWRFFVLRFSRLYPLHVVTLVATAILETI